MMSIDSNLEQIIAQFPDMSDFTDEQFLEANRMSPPIDKDNLVNIPHVIDREIDMDGNKINLRIYSSEEKYAPALLYLHGGGWSSGGLDINDSFCRNLQNACKWTIISVDYRLAPEHKYPAGLLDCYAALEWIYNHSDELGIDKTQIAVLGESSGGNLAAALALYTRDKKGPKIVKQILNFPVLDLVQFYSHDYTESMVDPEKQIILTKEAAERFINFYLASEEEAKKTYVSPLLETDFSNLPPTLIIVGEFDPLVDENIAYAKKLKEAKIPVKCQVFDGMVHGFTGFPIKQMFEVVEETTQFLNE